MRNDFFSTSDMKIIVTKTYPASNRSEDFEMTLEGDNEAVNDWHESIKNKYYLPKKDFLGIIKFIIYMHTIRIV